jgi:hypothetical protein
MILVCIHIWGKCNNLTSLKISNNSLTGSIPPEMAEATNLHIIDFSLNQLTGKIPFIDPTLDI